MSCLLLTVVTLVYAVPKVRSYVDNVDGTITDRVTGLMWEKEMEAMTWNDAVRRVSDVTVGGYNDWRIPSVKELFSLMLYSGSCSGDYSIKLFIDDNYFEQPLGDTTNGAREIDGQSWSSNDYDGQTMGVDVDTVFGVNLVDGRIKCYPKDDEKYLRLVRGNEQYGVNNFEDNVDGTVSDRATGLMWAKRDNGEGVNWQAALSYAQDSGLAGYNDWRLPSIKELNSIVDYSKSQNEAVIDQTVFQITQTTDSLGDPWYPYFWSSTTLLEGPGDQAIYQTFGRSLANFSGELVDAHGAGAVRGDPKAGNPDDYPASYTGYQGDIQYVYNYVRIVRDMQGMDTELTYPIVETNVTVCYNDRVEFTCPSAGQDYYGQDANYPPIEYVAVETAPPTRQPTTTKSSGTAGVLGEPYFYIPIAFVLICLFIMCFLLRTRLCGKRTPKTNEQLATP